MNGSHGQIPDLGRAGQATVLGYDLIPANAVDVLAGGLTDPNAIAHLRLLDLPKMNGHLAPITHGQAINLQDQLAAILSDQH